MSKPCPQEHWIRLNGGTADKSLRRIKCCKLRTGGFMVKHWKCVGRTHKDCPLNQTWPAKKKLHDKTMKELGA